MKPMIPSATNGLGGNNWTQAASMKSPASRSIPSPLQFALQSGSGGHTGPIKRPPSLNMSQRSSSVTYDGSQKNARLTPSPGSAPRSAGFIQRTAPGHPNQRSSATVTINGNSALQQIRSPRQLSLGFQRNTSGSPLLSPQSSEYIKILLFLCSFTNDLGDIHELVGITSILTLTLFVLGAFLNTRTGHLEENTIRFE